MYEKLDYIYYEGSLYEHRGESLKLQFEVLKRNHIKTEVNIRSLGLECFNEKLRKYILELELTEQVKLKNAVTEEVIRKEQAMANINDYFTRKIIRINKYRQYDISSGK